MKRNSTYENFKVEVLDKWVDLLYTVIRMKKQRVEQENTQEEMMKLTNTQLHLLRRLSHGLSVIDSPGTAPYLHGPPGSVSRYEDWTLRVHASTLRALLKRELILDVSVSRWRSEYIITDKGREFLAKNEQSI